MFHSRLDQFKVKLKINKYEKIGEEEIDYSLLIESTIYKKNCLVIGHTFLLPPVSSNFGPFVKRTGLKIRTN